MSEAEFRPLERKLKEALAKIDASLQMYNPDHHPPSVIVENYNTWIENVRSLFSEFRLVSLDLEGLARSEEEKEMVEENVRSVNANVNKFTRAMGAKRSAAESAPSSRASSAPLSRGSSARPSEAGSSASSLRQAEIAVEIDGAKISKDVKALSKEIKTVPDYATADNHEVEHGMNQIQEWKKRMREINNLLCNLKKTVRTYDLAEEGLTSREAAVEVLETSLEAVISDIEYEDKTRCLYSLSKTKPGDVKFPSFGGAEDENFSKFKREMIYAFKANKIPRSEQVSKLRECLKGTPKTYISADLENIDLAWRTLNFYGDPSRLMKAKKQKLKTLGQFPKIGSKAPSHLKTQLDYLMNLEILLKDLIEVSEESQDMYSELFNPSMLRSIKDNFPITILDEFDPLEGRGNVESKMKNFLDYIINLREKTQRHLEAVDVSDSASNKQDKAGTGGDKDKRSPAKVNFHTMFSKMKQPRRNEKCRVCKVLESEGDNEDLYDDHYGASAYGCPRMAGMITTERLRVGKKAQLCLDCLDADFVYRPRSKHLSCPVAERPQFYTCEHRGCRRHFFVCPDHLDRNKRKLENSVKFWTDKGKTFSSVVVMSSSTSTSSDTSLVQASCPEEQSSQTPETLFTCSSYPKTISEAARELQSLASGSKVIPPPEGEPLFMFSPVKGKTRDLIVFCDNGCSHAMFRTDIDQELDTVTLRTGPLPMNTAGNNVVMVKDEIAVALDLMDGTKQMVVGLTCDKLTSSFPSVRTEEAFKEIINNVPNNKKKMLSDLRVPELAGGEPDILLGIFYENIHPEVLHTLPSGLFVAKLKIANHGGYTACLGGPHKTFASLASQVGDTASLISTFTAALRQFQELGPPSLPQPMFTAQDFDLAETFNAVDVLSLVGKVPDDDIDQECDVVEVQHEDTAVMNEALTLQCDQCGDDVQDNIAELLEEVKEQLGDEHFANTVVEEFASEDKLADLKTLIKIQNEGISLTYRCPSCRNCGSCRNSNETELWSVREEIEDERIRQCVKLDFNNKKIVAILPLRGDENKFLSNNREVAEKVLISQCQKFKNDENTRNDVAAAFKKLRDRSYAVKFEDLTDEQKKLVESKPLQHYLPWRVVFKPDSASTATRCVMDASTKTPVTADGRGGHCLNNLSMKGRVNTLDLVTMLLRFVIGEVGLCGDLQGFYPSISLHESQWNLQRVLFKEGLDLDSDTLELLFITLIYGVRSVSALSERAVLDLADHVASSSPEVAEFIRRSRFVDDLATSHQFRWMIDQLIRDSDEVFGSVGLKVKGWTKTGDDPHEDVTKDGLSVDVGGISWSSRLDTVSVKVPPLHFGRKVRGKIQAGTEIFSGTFSDLCNFVPKKISRRTVVSKFASFYDPWGKFEPFKAVMRVHLRAVMSETDGWDSFISDASRKLWMKDWWRLETLRGLSFPRARIPTDAADTNIQIICAVDASTQLKAAGCWVRFKRRNGTMSCQQIIGRSVLSKEGVIIARLELDSLVMGSNLNHIVNRAYEGWTHDYVILSDSVIALCWVTAENKRLGMWHRTRCNQVRMNTDLSKLFHVISECNPVDCLTRPEKIGDDAVGRGSAWEEGLPWMTESLEEAILQKILRPAADLRPTDAEHEEYQRGFIIEKSPEILIEGHSIYAVNDMRVSKLEQRAVFSKYVFLPSKFDFRKTVLVTSLVYKFIRKLKYKRFKTVQSRFKMFPCTYVGLSAGKVVHVGLNWSDDTVAEPDNVGKSKRVPVLDNQDISRSLNYWFTKATKEVEHFMKPEVVSKISVKKDGILYSRSRIHNTQRMLEAGDFKHESLGLEIGLNVMTPVVDRYSPIAYSIAMFIHNRVGLHAGVETCYRLSLDYCFIYQASSLFREIADECSKCQIIKKKFIEVCMGPVSDSQLSIAPVFHVAYVDLDGPINVYVPGFERETRNRKIKTSKCWIMTFVCPMSKLTNMQVLESKNAESVLEGLTRLACEVGMPSCLIMDQETSLMKMVRDAEVNMRDLSYRVFKEFGVQCQVVPVQGHNYNGVAERKIRSVQEVFKKIGVDKCKLHAMGLQTFCKLVENHLNNTPLGYSYGRDSNNSPILKIITPNFLRVGRINSRSLAEPLKFPSGPGDYMKRVNELYLEFFKIWNVSVFPKMIPQTKWWRDGPELKVEDVILFQKTSPGQGVQWSDEWTVGQVDSVTRSKDGVVRRVNIRYFNAGDSQPKFTDRAVRSLVRLFNIEDNYFIEDMAEVEKLMKKTQENLISEDKIKPIRVVRTEDGGYKVKDADRVVAKCASCCCVGHCVVSHYVGQETVMRSTTKITAQMIAHKVGHDPGHIHFVPVHPEMPGDADVPGRTLDDDDLYTGAEDEYYRILTCLETKFDLPEMF